MVRKNSKPKIKFVKINKEFTDVRNIEVKFKTEKDDDN